MIANYLLSKKKDKIQKLSKNFSCMDEKCIKSLIIKLFILNDLIYKYMKLKLLHLITNTFMAKAHASFDDNEDITNYYIYTRYRSSPIVSFLPTGTQVLKGKDKNHFQVRSRINNTTSPIIIKSIINFIDQNKPDAIFLSDPNLLNSNLFNHIIKNYKLYFINHGITNNDAIKQIMVSDKINNNNIGWSNFTGVFITKKEECLWRTNDRYVRENRIHVLPGITQIDYLKEINLIEYKKLIYQHIDPNTGNLSNDVSCEGISLDKKSILFIQNKNLTYNKHQQIAETKSILSFLVKYCQNHNYHLFLKIKHISQFRNTGIKSITNLTTLPNVTVLDASDNKELLLYHFLFADAIVIQNYGTTLTEGLLINPRVVRTQFLKKDDSADMNKFPLLAQAFDQSSLELWLNTFFEDSSFPTVEYEKQRQEYIIDNLGELTDLSITDLIIKQVKQDILLNSIV